MQLAKAATIALGAFNPAIPTPAWLTRQNILEPGTYEHGTLLTYTGSATRFRRGTLSWMVTPDRLVVETVGEAEWERPLVLATEILRVLPHTPVQAVGVNLDFVLQEPSDVVLSSLRGINFGDLPGTRLVTDVSVVQADAEKGIQLKVHLSRSESETRAKFNFHCDLLSAAEAIKYLEGASKFYDEARTITARLEK